MTDSPKPTPGWYPDPDMVDTVRYWDGNDWTEQRAPARQKAGTNPPTASPHSPQPKKSKKKIVIWSAVAAVTVLALVLGISLKKGMDNTVANGVALADALTVNDQEIAAAGEAINSIDDSAPDSSVGACGSMASASAEGLWKGALVEVQYDAGSVLFTFGADCSLQAGETAPGDWLQTDSDVTFNFGAWRCTGTLNGDATSMKGRCKGPTLQSGEVLRGKGTLTRVS